ncbi:hypothetical protein ACTHOQ_03895 [Solibacillus silvestris]|uniref:hypothetical protein n=1 Tax=Solibacillus silvestris TaxID=76853 RepID=UPI003F7DD736
MNKWKIPVFACVISAIIVSAYIEFTHINEKHSDNTKMIDACFENFRQEQKSVKLEYTEGGLLICEKDTIQ